VGLFVSADGQAAELGFSLAREAQGRGIASAVRAAVQRLLADTPVRVIHAQTDARNLACLRLLERLGAPRVTHAWRPSSAASPCVESATNWPGAEPRISHV
jgi:RimJ/RimL family protein N-acetyltransferase